MLTIVNTLRGRLSKAEKQFQKDLVECQAQVAGFDDSLKEV